MSRRALGAFLVVAVAPALVVTERGNATAPGGNGKIAFVRYNDANAQLDLFAANPDGTGETNLTADFDGDVWSADWSPNGARIAFMQGVMQADDHDFPSRWRLFLMNSDGTAKTRLASFAAILPEPAWSPDGSVIAFPRLDGTSMQLYTIHPDGSGLRRITRLRTMLAVHPSWSPDGREIAFAGFDFRTEAEPQIYVVNADGSGLRRLTRGAQRLSPDWSPDGSQLVFEGPRGIFVMNRDGTARRLLVRDPGFDFAPQWSPDGTKILFSSSRWHEYRTTVGVANADGTCPTRVVAPEASNADWQAVPGGPSSDPLRCADLAVRARVDKRFGVVGERITFTIDVANRGNPPATGARLAIPVARDISVASVVTSQGSCVAGRPTRCDIGTLAPSARARVEVVFRGRRGKFAVFRVAAATDANDPDPSTNRADDSLWICSRRGSARSERLIGTAGDDVVCAFGGDDTIRVGAGRDRVFAGDGHDNVRAGGGGDIVVAGRGNDVVRAGAGRDDVIAGGGADRVEAGKGADTVEGGTGSDVLHGGPGDDDLLGGPGRDYLYGGDGNDDLLDYDGFRDVLDGGPGRDSADASPLDLLRSIEVGVEKPSRLTGLFRPRR